MSYFLTIIHECKDFGPWKNAFDADADNRRAAGLTDLVLAREESNLNLIGLVFGASDLAKARAMTQSPVLREAMRAGGVVGTPIVHFRQGEFTDRNAPYYLTLNCRISGIEKFKAGYALDRNDRVAASLTDCALLQDVDDPNDLALLWSVDDLQKARAFLKSPGLAEHQVKHAGLVGPSQARFWRR